MIFNKGVAVVTVSRRGRETASRIKTALSQEGHGANIYTIPKYASEETIVMNRDLGVFMGELFPTVDAIIAVMAVGIVVRTIAPYLRSKKEDPAVVAVDDLGKFAISLVSGHLGGANELARWIGSKIKAIPVITTASDLLEKKDIDEVALKLRCSVENFHQLPAVDSAIVDGKRVLLAVLNDIDFPVEGTAEFEAQIFENLELARNAINNGYDAGAIFSRKEVLVEGFEKPVVWLKPKRVVAGIGAKREVSMEDILECINLALKEIGLPIQRIDALATAEIKKDTPAIDAAAQFLERPIKYIDMKTLESTVHPDLSPPSQAVIEKVGVPGVAEQAALATVGSKGKLIVRKIKYEGKVTAAIAEGS